MSLTAEIADIIAVVSAASHKRGYDQGLEAGAQATAQYALGVVSELKARIAELEAQLPADRRHLTVLRGGKPDA